MRVLSPKFLIPALILAAGALAAPALAQPGVLPANVINAGTIAAADQQAIDEFVGKWMKDLGSDDAEKVKKAREALAGPVMEQNISVPFRLAYSKALTDAKLADLCKSANETVAINALRLAGEAAETQTLGLLKDGFSDKRSAVRYAAVFGAMRAFEQVIPPAGNPNGRAPAVASGALEQLVASTAVVLNKDKEEALVVDAASRALLAAARIDRPKFEGVAKSGAVQACQGLSKRLTAAGKDDWTIVEAAGRAASQFQQSLGGAKGAQVDAEVRKEAAGLGGDLIAWVCRQLNAGAVPEGGDAKVRDPYAVALAAGENVVLYAIKAAGGPLPGAKLVPAFGEGNKQGDAKVVIEAGKLVGEMLTKAPFGFSADRFALKGK